MAIKSDLLIAASILAALSIFAEPITNACDIIGIPLSSNVWERIPVRDRSTVDNVFMGSIRSFFTGNLSDVKFYFTDDLWKAATGLEPDGGVSDSQGQNFNSAICDGCISNQVIVSLSRTTTNSMHMITSMITENIGRRETTNNFRFVFALTNSAWRVDDLFLDGVSVRSDDD